ncbi:hypothetical protein LXL04_029050 [Taraxacum kok-saghyz]
MKFVRVSSPLKLKNTSYLKVFLGILSSSARSDVQGKNMSEKMQSGAILQISCSIGVWSSNIPVFVVFVGLSLTTPGCREEASGEERILGIHGFTHEKTYNYTHTKKRRACSGEGMLCKVGSTFKLVIDIIRNEYKSIDTLKSYRIGNRN